MTSMFVLQFVALFALVFTRGFQQKNMQHDRYAWMIPTSMLFYGAEIVAGTIIFSETIAAYQSGEVTVRAVGYWFFGSMGAGTGAICGGWTHNKWLGQK